MKKVFVFLILVMGLISTAIVLWPQPAFAQYELQAPFPDQEGTISSEGGFAQYVNMLYKFAIPLMGMLATIMTIYAGYKYMTAYGNPQQIQEAKEIFTGAITGIILVITAVVLLNLIGGDSLTTIDI